MKRIAIIYYNAGLGHLREALALRDILEPEGYSLVLVNFNEIITGFYSDVGNIYEKMQKNGMSKFLSLSWWRNPPDILIKLLNKIERRKEREFTITLERYLTEKRVDFVVATHFFPAGALACSRRYKEKTISICVDNMWKNSAWAYSVPGIKTVVPTAESYKNVYLRGILGVGKKDIVLAGHPFPPDLVKERYKMHKRRMKKFYSDEPLDILVTTGGAGTNEKEMVEVLDGGKESIISKKATLVLWCNHHSDMRIRFDEKAASFGLDRCSNLRIISTKTKIEAIFGLHEEIKKCDILVTKPGELAMYGGLAPMYLFGPTSSQEYSLADFSYQHKYSKDAKDIGAKNIIGYADSHRDELRLLSENGMKNPLVRMQEKNALQKFLVNSIEAS